MPKSKNKPSYLKIDPKTLTEKELFDCLMGAHLAAEGWKETVRLLTKEMERRKAKKKGKKQ